MPAAVATMHGLCQCRRAGGPQGFPSHPMTTASRFFCPGGPWLPLDRTPCQSLLSAVPGKDPHTTVLPSDPPPPAWLWPMRGYPTVKPSPLGWLTMQGVGQHAGHTLHHHLVGGLEESRGWGRGLPSLGTWHSRGTTSSSKGKTGIPQLPVGSANLGSPHLSANPPFPPPRSATGSCTRPHGSQEAFWYSLRCTDRVPSMSYPHVLATCV